MITIYKYTNTINQKVYIGQTCQTLSQRAKKNGEGYKHCLHFYSAIQKYGWDKFKVDILEDNLPNEIADEREKYYIKLYNSVKNGYNIDYGGHIEKTRSEETKKKISESGEGLKNSRAKNVCYSGVPSNQSIRDYAREHNMSESTLRNWCREKRNGYSYF